MYSDPNDNPNQSNWIDKRFQRTNDYTKMPSVDFVDIEYQKSQRDYGTAEFATDAIMDIIREHTHIPFVDPFTVLRVNLGLLSILGYTDIVQIGLSGVGMLADSNQDVFMGMAEEATKAFEYYLLNKDDPYTLSEGQVAEVLLFNAPNLDHLEYNVNAMMRAVEQTATNNTVMLETTSDANFLSCCYVNRGHHCAFSLPEYEPFKSIPHGLSTFSNTIQYDWNTAIGEAFNGMTCVATQNDDTYTMLCRYYIIDIYEWVPDWTPGSEDNLSNVLHMLYQNRKAKEFLMNGYFEFPITWHRNEGMSENVRKQLYAALRLKYAFRGPRFCIIADTSIFLLDVYNDFCKYGEDFPIDEWKTYVGECW